MSNVTIEIKCNQVGF